MQSLGYIAPSSTFGQAGQYFPLTRGQGCEQSVGLTLLLTFLHQQPENGSRLRRRKPCLPRGYPSYNAY